MTLTQEERKKITREVLKGQPLEGYAKSALLIDSAIVKTETIMLDWAIEQQQKYHQIGIVEGYDQAKRETLRKVDIKIDGFKKAKKGITNSQIMSHCDVFILHLKEFKKDLEKVKS